MSSGKVVQANAFVGCSSQSPPCDQWSADASYPGLYLAYPARIRSDSGDGRAVSSTALPSTMTTSAPHTPDHACDDACRGAGHAGPRPLDMDRDLRVLAEVALPTRRPTLDVPMAIDPC